MLPGLFKHAMGFKGAPMPFINTINPAANPIQQANSRGSMANSQAPGQPSPTSVMATSGTPVEQEVAQEQEMRLQQEREAKEVENQQRMAQESHELDVQLKQIKVQQEASKPTEANVPPYLKGTLKRLSHVGNKARSLNQKLMQNRFKTASELLVKMAVINPTFGVPQTGAGFKPPGLGVLGHMAAPHILPVLAPQLQQQKREYAQPDPNAFKANTSMKPSQVGKYVVENGQYLKRPAREGEQRYAPSLTGYNQAPDMSQPQPDQYANERSMPHMIGQNLGSWIGDKARPFTPETPEGLLARQGEAQQRLGATQPYSVGRGWAHLRNFGSSVAPFAKDWTNGILGGTADFLGALPTQAVQTAAHLHSADAIRGDYMQRNPGASWVDVPNLDQYGQAAGRAAAVGLGGGLLRRFPGMLKGMLPATGLFAAGDAFRSMADRNQAAGAMQNMGAPPAGDPGQPGGSAVEQAGALTEDVVAQLRDFISNYGTGSGGGGEMSPARWTPGVNALEGAVV